MPTTVPSAFMVTDVLLLLNDLLDKKLFPVNPNESLMQKAAEEAVKIKRLMQALRYLFRASGSIADWFMKAGSMLCFVSKQKHRIPGKRSRFTRIADLKRDLGG